MKEFRILAAIAFGALWSVSFADSVCFGTTSEGRLARGCELPASGDNFSAYSTLGRWIGRTWVHCQVRDVVVSAYEELAAAYPEKRFVYGETGFKTGGEFKPHKTHRNGLSVDFMVPVTNVSGRSVPLPTGITNTYGYELEFDAAGRLDDLRIDFEAIALHLEALRRSATKQGIGIWRVIFDPQLQSYLRETEHWSEISGLQFSTRRSWVRHDDHYHVDFEVPCRPMSEWGGDGGG